MNRKKLSRRAIGIAIFVFFLNVIAMKFYWYSSIWWLDMPMHIFGGVFVGLLYFLIFSVRNFSVRDVWKILGWILLIGLGWEFFELFAVNHLMESPFILLDTLSDLFFDLAGGSVAIIYFQKRIVIKKENII